MTVSADGISGPLPFTLDPTYFSTTNFQISQIYRGVFTSVIACQATKKLRQYTFDATASQQNDFWTAHQMQVLSLKFAIAAGDLTRC